MTDAKALWWPPLQRFYDFLVEINARDSGGDAKEIEVCHEHAHYPHADCLSFMHLSSVLAHRIV